VTPAAVKDTGGVTTPADWPGVVRRRLAALGGAVVAVEPLGGMGGGMVARARFAPQRRAERSSLVVKASPRAIETEIYRTLGDTLRAAGVGLPEVYASCRDGNGHWWLLLEDVPWPLPRERWLADGEVLATLARLHALVPLPNLPAGAYAPAWTREMSAAAMSTFSIDSRARLVSILHGFEAEAQPLFAPAGLISGDPNPRNWGLRADSSLVLFDIERLSLGAPALDLAITVPGLGTRDDFERVAAGYARARPHFDTHGLSRQIATAKVWSVVELLSQIAAGHTIPSDELNPLLRRVPDWLATLSAN
jgi:hypothetical protein